MSTPVEDAEKAREIAVAVLTLLEGRNPRIVVNGMLVAACAVAIFDGVNEDGLHRILDAAIRVAKSAGASLSTRAKPYGVS